MPIGAHIAFATVGVDPGKDGSVAVLSGRTAVFYDTPTLKAGTGGKRVYDVAAMVRLVQGLPPGLVVLETQQAMPSIMRGRAQGTVSSFSTGFGFGLWQGILTALGRSYTLVHPLQWKRAMMAGEAKEKAASVIVASRLFPQAAVHLVTPRGRALDGRADALLIAAYGRRSSL